MSALVLKGIRSAVAIAVLAAALCVGAAHGTAAQDVTAAVPAAVFFPVVPYDAPSDAQPSFVPLAANHPLTGDHAGITRAIVVIHDFSRDATRALAVMSTLAGAGGESTLILAPQFLLDSDIARFAAHLPDRGTGFARWPLGGWSGGGDSLATGRQKGVSSFTVLDLLLMFLDDRQSFPDLATIVVAGHGEGADFVQRYAAAGRAPDVMERSLRFVVANASSFLYLTKARPRTGKPGFGPLDAKPCADADNWPSGVDALNAYARRAGANAMKLGYLTKDTAYLAGAAAASNDPAPDTSCAARVQGRDRAERAATYAAYLATIYGDVARTRHTLALIPTAGYDAVALFGSSCGMALLFGDGDCAGGLVP